jgi:hypothetical protein
VQESLDQFGCNIDKLFRVPIVNIVVTISHLDKFIGILFKNTNLIMYFL